MRFRYLLIAVIVLFALPRTGQALEDYKKLYLQGLEQKNAAQFEQAVASFSQAIAIKDAEKKRMRFYGMRYGEYFPHREKGICHFELQQYRQAYTELEKSMQMEKSSEAKKYLALAKMELKKLGETEVLRAYTVPPELKEHGKPSKINKYGVAVVIGNRDYKDKDIPPVKFAINDARLVKEYLVSTLGFREGNIIFAPNASKGIFEEIFGTHDTYKGKLYNYLTPGKSDIFVYYSGHGAPSLETKKGYILPIDGNPNNVQIGGYALDLLYHNLAQLNARSITVVTDACFSGAPLFKKASPVGIVVKNPLATHAKTTIINSSGGTELSSWYPEKGHGLFTYYFLRGLGGAADINKDHKITMAEVKEYVSDNVPYMARTLYDGRKQTPSVQSADLNNPLVTYK